MRPLGGTMGKKKKKSRRSLVCPNCGARFPEGRLSCPECGSDAQTGWKSPEEIFYQSVELPEWDDEPQWTPPGRKAWIPRAPRGAARKFGPLFFWVLFVLALFALVTLGYCAV